MDDIQQQARIANILGTNVSDIDVNFEHAMKYLRYLENNIIYPCPLVLYHRLSWEEPFAAGYGTDEQYEEERKNEPSCYDSFDLIRLIEPGDEPIMAEVRRNSDKKIFEIHLHWLISENPDHPNARLFDDYSFWHVNYW